MPLDFTFRKYAEIVDAIARSGYPVLKIVDYIQADPKPDRCILIRHDVDLDPACQVQYAEMEMGKGISASYYFRCTKKVFHEDVISKIYSMGHEVGYHYEVFTKTKGDREKAVTLFRDEQARFKKNWNSLTVCPHGGSFKEEIDGYTISNMLRLIPMIASGKKVFADQINFDMWKGRRFEDFDVIGDAYHSINFHDILYLSDTGRSWDQRYKRLDRVDSAVNQRFSISSSNDVIDIIDNKKADKIYLLVHFEQWKDSIWEWSAWYASQLIRQLGKRLIFGSTSYRKP